METTITESTFRESLRAFKAGKATKAFAIFLADPTSNTGTNFLNFCEGMNRVLSNKGEKKPLEIHAHDDAALSR